MNRTLTRILGSIASVLIVLFIVGISVVPFAFLLMLSIGNASIASGGVVPALGFASSYWLSFPIVMIAGSASSVSRVRPKE